MSNQKMLFWTILLCSGLTACNPVPDPNSQKPISASSLSMPDGFMAELLYAPSVQKQGSWVSITTDHKGRLITSDQYGNLYRMTPPKAGKTLKRRDIETLGVEIGHAQGLLYAFNSLYVSVNADEGLGNRNSGLYRLQDTNGDDQFDKITQLKSFEGDGEHGPHAIVLGPEGKHLYLIGGNHTDLPKMDAYLRPANWQEDQLFPLLKDPRGHAADRTAPGGWVARTDEEGRHWTLFSSGYRNPYDMAFNQDGELFVFDSDMEWDMGMPWYRPIRLCHAVAGSEFGWRTGSGKFQPYYEDNLPPVVNIGQGSPTGVLYGKSSHFPSRYQDGMFLFDWSFGTIYYVTLSAEGSTYKGIKEEFLSGIPFPVADGVFGEDGAMYIVTGGRRGVSGLYRISYPEPSQISTVKYEAHESQEELRALRTTLSQTYHNPSISNIDLLWENLDHPDRFIHYTAYTGLEHHSIDLWKAKYLKETNPDKLIPASIALAHTASPKEANLAFTKLGLVSFQNLSDEQKLSFLRALELVCIRLDAPGPLQKALFRDKLSKAFPNRNDQLNQELAKLLVFLEKKGVQEDILDLMDQKASEKEDGLYIGENITARSEQYGPDIENMLKNFPPTQNVSYANYLSQASKHWEEKSLSRYFNWFYEATSRSGGMSYRGFIDKIRLSTLDKLSEEQRASLGDLAKSWDSGIDLSTLPQPEGPGRDYNKQEVGRLIGNRSPLSPDFSRGEQLYEAALCAACHQMNGKGGNIGPDLTQAYTRFNNWSLLDAIFSPSQEVSDQYASTILTLKNGEKVIGRLMDETADSVSIGISIYDPSLLKTLSLSEVESREKSAISPMPPGLLNRLNEQEIVDLIGYIQSGGNASHEIYQNDK
ncbi:MAG: c-type cytochrome [Bacteroidota bacterium]